MSAATLHRIHATLRAALNGTVRAGLISVNPGRYPEPLWPFPSTGHGVRPHHKLYQVLYFCVPPLQQ